MKIPLRLRRTDSGLALELRHPGQTAEEERDELRERLHAATQALLRQEFYYQEECKALRGQRDAAQDLARDMIGALAEAGWPPPNGDPVDACRSIGAHANTWRETALALLDDPSKKGILMITRHRIRVPAALLASLPPAGQPPKVITLGWQLPAPSVVLGYQLGAAAGGLTFPGGAGSSATLALQGPGSIASPNVLYAHGNVPLYTSAAWLVANAPKSIRLAASGDTPSGGEVLVDILYEDMTTIESTG
jgi:hypothetical protein